MEDKINEMIEVKCLEIELLFIELEWKIYQLFKDKKHDEKTE